jgi:hypothetical protein
MPTPLTDYLEVVCGVDTSALPESGAIQISLTNRCDLDVPDVIITPEDQFEGATITLRSQYVDRRSQASAMPTYRRISGTEAMLNLSLHNPFEERFANIFLRGRTIAAAPAPAPAPSPTPTPSPSPSGPREAPWTGRRRIEYRSDAGKLPNPYVARIQFLIGSGEFAPLELYAPLAFPTFDEIALQRSVDTQSGANVMLELKPSPDYNGSYLIQV